MTDQEVSYQILMIEVADIDGLVKTLREAGVHFRNDVIAGVGGSGA